MVLQIDKHRNVLIAILKDIYTDSTIGPMLGFKGGTAAYLLYGLERFSVDLDFDLTDPDKEEYVFERLNQILTVYGKIKTKHLKYFTIFFEISYGDTDHNIKLEVNRRIFGSSYEVVNFLGIPMLVMTREDMFAHKLMAMYERIGRTNRDIYDVWFFLHKNWPINKAMVEERAKMPFKELLEKCIARLEKMPDRRILHGIGEFLTDKQKDWARTKLRIDTIFLLRVLHDGER